MTSIAFLIATAILLVVAVLHMMWGLRIWWPEPDEQKLVRMVAGAKDSEKMPPPFACFIVATALVCMAVILIWHVSFGTVPFVKALGAAMVAVFAGRGLATYLGLVRKFAPEEPFNSYDSKYYAPLCLILAVTISVVIF